MDLQQLMFSLERFWSNQGCIIQQPYDIEVGAGTMHPATFLKVLGPEPWNTAYVQPSRRPADGRYGENPFRTQHYYQYQVIMKPSPSDIQDVYLDSLKALGIEARKHDIRFVEDDWEAPTLGAWGLGWEVWLDGMEITQFTYFQQIGGIDLKPVSVEITYGIERLAMYLQDKDSFFDLVWTKDITYGQIFHQNEIEYSKYHFDHASNKFLVNQFEQYEDEAHRLVLIGLVLPAYDWVLKCSHVFNLLDASGALSVTERTAYIARVRTLARKCALKYLEIREDMGFPLLKQSGGVSK